MDTSKTVVLLRKNMVFGGLGAPRSSKCDPEDLIGEVFGDLGEHFGGLGGSWEQVGNLMDFGTLPGTAQIQITWSGSGYRQSPGSSRQSPNTRPANRQLQNGCQEPVDNRTEKQWLQHHPSQPGGP